VKKRIVTALLLIAAVGTSVPAAAQRAPKPSRDAALEARLGELVSAFRGTVGIYVRHLCSGRYAAVNADELFPTASMIKVPIMLTLFQQIEDGRLGWLDTLTYRDSLLYAGEDDLLGKLRDSTPIPLAQVAMLMITTSDNTASLWLQKLVGTGTAINAWLAGHGFDSTRVNSRTPGREEARSNYGWGQTTPREMAELLVRIRDQRAVSPAADQEMFRMLTRIYWNGEALSQIPPWTQAASKQGAVDHSRSEVVLVNAPSGDYVFSVITKGQADTTYAKDNEGYVLLRRVSALLWSTFEPRHPWSPAPGVERFKP
jgi:beta-lactamase class A